MYLITTPSLGVNDSKGTIVNWDVTTGDTVEKGNTICSFETAKAVIDLEVEYSGIITLVRAEGEEVTEGETIAVIAKSVFDLNSLDLPSRKKTSKSNITQPIKHSFFHTF